MSLRRWAVPASARNPSPAEPCRAGSTSATTGAEAGQAGPVTFDQLGQMLAGIGGNPQVNNDVYLFQIKDESGITYPLGIFLSQDQRAIYFFIPLVNLDQAG